MRKLTTGIFLTALSLTVCVSSSCTSKAMAENADYDFEYREIYLPEHGTEEYENLGLHNLDNAWGLWGHNLAQILPDSPSHTIYAHKDGATHREQFCFSSEDLYEYIEKYVHDNYNWSDTTRFAILPNDNLLVCTCAKCVAAGNTEKDASPAVLKLIHRLSERFPGHIFFTSYYASTRSIPTEPLPRNAGVLISAIDFPLSTAVTKSEHEFEDLLSGWSKVTDRIYVWDYVNNFDDYFTPYPIFGPMQKRLKMYKNLGVEGLFMNGSGPDYSTFSRLKTHVLAEMMKDPDTDWRPILIQKAKELYPTAGDLISTFMIAQEDYVEKQGKELPLYKGITDATEIYLPENEFIEFHDALADAIGKASGEEKTELSLLYNAMELTRLELMRKNGDITGYETHLDNLMKLAKENDINVYSETCWTLPSYERDYRKIAAHAEESVNNKLKGVRLQALNALDPDYNDISVLTDGLLGMPSNYHNGILINSPEEKWSIGIPPVGGIKTLRIWLVTNPAFRVGLPKRINVLSGGNLLGSVEPTLSGEKVGHTFVDFKIPSGAGALTLTFGRDKEVRSMAIEEIEGY